MQVDTEEILEALRIVIDALLVLERSLQQAQTTKELDGHNL